MGNQIAAEWGNVSGAPFLFIGAVLLVGLGIWTFVHFIYKAKIERLEQDVRSEQAEVSRLRAKLAEDPERNPVASPRSSGAESHPTVTGPEGGASSNKVPRQNEEQAPAQSTPPATDPRKHALVRFTNAAYAAGMALGESSPQGMGAAIPSLESALLSLEQAYEIAVPKLAGAKTPKRALTAFGDYAKLIGPFLKDGHIEEARHRAAYLCGRLDAFMRGEGGRPNV